MKRIVTLAAFLTLVALPSGAAAQTTYTVRGKKSLDGNGCIDKGDFLIKFQFRNIDEPQEFKVQFSERVPHPNQSPVPVCDENGVATGRVVYKVKTDTTNTGKIEKFCPNKELVVCSPGSCGPKLEFRDTIKATITPNEVTIQCTKQNYTVNGTPKPKIIFDPSEFQDQPRFTPNREEKLYNLQYEDDKVKVETGMIYENPSVMPCVTGDWKPLFRDGITITVKNCEQNPHVVQFIHREQFLLADGSREPNAYGPTDRNCNQIPKFWLTTNPSDPAWHTDSGAKLRPYLRPSRIDNCNSMTTWDAPSLTGFNPEKYKLWRATFVSFVLCNGEVVRQIPWTRESYKNESGLIAMTYHVEKEKVMAPDPELLKKFQCLSTLERFYGWPAPACDKLGWPEGPPCRP